jgi:magnesium transporter
MDTRHLEHLEKRLNTFEEDIFSDRDIDTSEFFKLKKELIDNRSDCKDLLELFDILESTLEKIQSDRTNKRLNVLTIWSTLFLPLSFFTGLFGMNFNDIPLLQNHYGFWFFVVISVITVGWLWVYFKRNKWF